jgi:NADH-quinone oxidoreductase subunit G
MAKMINLQIDDQPVSVPAGTLVVDAAKMIGNDIPVFCYHPKMEPVGMCRMCLVEIGRPVVDRSTGEVQKNEDGTPRVQFGPKLETACTTPVSEGMVVRTTTENVTGARREILEFLLTSHPLDCPICDKGGECPLQNLTMAHGPGKSRFLLDDKIHLAKHYPLGELIFLDRERCIQCARCIRFQSDIAGDPVISFAQRGRSLQIITNSEPGFDSYFSGNTTDICPVGALTTADFRFAARPWEMKAVGTICTHCPVGCNLTLNVRREAVTSGRSVIKRVMPRQNEDVNEIWICDKGRFAYHYAESGDRLVQPLVRRGDELVKVSWDEALEAASDGLRSAAAGTVVLAGGRLANEDLFNLRALADGIGARTLLHTHMAGGEWTARLGLAPDSNIGSIGPETAILVVASDLEEEAPVWYLRVRAAAKRGARLVVANPRPTKLDEVALHTIRYHYGEEAAVVRGFMPAGQSGGGRSIDAAVLEALTGAENLVIFYGSEGLGLEGTRGLSGACAALLLATNRYGRSNNGLLAAWDKANTQGAYDMGFQPADDLADVLGRAGALYIAAADPAGDSPQLSSAVRRAGFVVVQELFLTPTALMADVVLPVQSFPEREGTFTSGERRVQRFYPAVAAFDNTRADFRITAELGQRLGQDVEGRAASLVFQRIAAQIPDYSGLSYPGLAQVREQWPPVARGDLYYGGTGYENRQGLGIRIAPGVLSGRWTPDPASLPAASSMAGKPAAQGGELWVVPVTRLYDRGMTVLPSPLLRARMARPELCLHPQTAAALGLAENDQIVLAIDEAQVQVQIKTDDTLPEGAALAPRSVGIPVFAPQAVKFQRAAEPVARL